MKKNSRWVWGISLLVAGMLIMVSDMSAYAQAKKVKVLEVGGSDRKFIEDLFSPLNIVTINTIWLPDGSIESRAVVSGSPRRIPIEVESLKILAKEIKGINLRVEFEKTLDRKLSWT